MSLNDSILQTVDGEESPPDTDRLPAARFLDEALLLRTRLMYGLVFSWMACCAAGIYTLTLNQLAYQVDNSRLNKPQALATLGKRMNARARTPTAPQLGINAKTETEMWERLAQWLEQQAPQEGMCWIAPQDLSKSSKIKLNYPLRCTGQTGKRQDSAQLNTQSLRTVSLWSAGFSSLDFGYMDQPPTPLDNQAQSMSPTKAEGWLKTPGGSLIYQPEQEKWTLKP